MFGREKMEEVDIMAEWFHLTKVMEWPSRDAYNYWLAKGDYSVPYKRPEIGYEL